MSTSRGLIKSMLIMGTVRSANIAIGILRAKLVAMILGPTGIGLLGVYGNFLGLSSSVAGLGLGSSGVRQIAASRGDEGELSLVQRVLFAANLVQGFAALALIWAFRERLALLILGDADYAFEVGLVGIAVLLTLIGNSQTALLQGMRRVADLARVSAMGALIGSAIGVGAVWTLGTDGVVWLIVALPAASAVVAAYYGARLPRPNRLAQSHTRTGAHWRAMVRLGLVFMAGGLLTAGTLLWVRSVILQDLGADAAGYFQAAWAISMQNVGFLFGAMAADFYPRLTEAIEDRAESLSLVNDQLQIGLAIGGPIILAMIGLAPWILELLYTAEFSAASSLLQWQMLGNLLKLAAWPIGFIIVAKGRSTLFFLTQAVWNVLFLAVVFVGLDRFGLHVTGIAFALAYLLQLGLQVAVARRVHDFRLERLSLRLLGFHLSLAGALLLLAQFDPLACAVAGPIATLATAAIGLRIVVHKMGPSGAIAGRIAAIYASFGWPLENRNAQ